MAGNMSSVGRDDFGYYCPCGLTPSVGVIALYIQMSARLRA